MDLRSGWLETSLLTRIRLITILRLIGTAFISKAQFVALLDHGVVVLGLSLAWEGLHGALGSAEIIVTVCCISTVLESVESWTAEKGDILRFFLHRLNILTEVRLMLRLSDASSVHLEHVYGAEFLSTLVLAGGRA